MNHIYFQYTPFLAGWGTKLWGHYTTKDWIHYKEEEPFLYPDEEWDRDGVYSGSAYTCEDGIHYFYTGNVKLWDKDYDYIMNGRGTEYDSRIQSGWKEYCIQEACNDQ